MCDTDEEEEDWEKPVGSDFPEVTKTSPELRKLDTTFVGCEHSRVILHIDIDCFYAQVEMIRNPELRNKPLGIQQKYIVVTCNYPAREQGVTKLMRITDAKEKCPNLVLVSGEDLTNYREMSYKISNYLQKYCPLVERLGFDENFLDITDLVNDRINSGSFDEEVKGHVYNPEAVKDLCGCGCHQRLKVGSQVAADIREGLCSELGITSCGGVAVNKLLSKLVASKHKPNQQTTLFPEQTQNLMGELTGVRQIPGIGHTTGRRLKEIGINTVQELQNVDKTVLEDEFGSAAAENMKKLCFGIDESPVIAFGLPQTLSDEDSFKKCASVVEVKKKLKELITSLLERLLGDGRIPHTFRLSVRKLSPTGKYLNRESRQCPLSSAMFSKFSKETLPNVCSQLETQAYSLFIKMIDIKQPFHLTLINVAFAKLEQISRNSIANFFSPRKTPKDEQFVEQDVKLAEDHERTHAVDRSSLESLAKSQDGKMSKEMNSRTDNQVTESLINRQRPNSGVMNNQKTKTGLHRWLQKQTGKDESVIKLNVGSENTREVNKTQEGINKRKDDTEHNDTDKKCLKPEKLTGEIPTQTDTCIPDNVDRNVFLQLPLDIQKEILENSKRNPLPLKSSKSHSSHQSEENVQCDEKDINSSHSQSYSAGRCVQNSLFFSKVDRGKTLQKTTTPKPFFSTVKSIDQKSSVTDKNMNFLTPKTIDTVQTCASTSQQKQLDKDSKTTLPHPDSTKEIPPHIDRTVFETLPKEIQMELIEDWKRKQALSAKRRIESISIKNPPPSSENNIMSYFPKANKK